MKENTYVHCSWDIINPKLLIPAVPDSRGINEDAVTPRICVSKSIKDALRAMPGTGQVIRGIRKWKIPAIIHAYYLSGDKKRIYRPTKSQVPDVEVTGEIWMLEKPDKIFRRDYLITDELLVPVTDINGIFHEILLECTLKRVRNQSNFKNLETRHNVNSEKIKDIVTFRKLMSNTDLLLYEYMENKYEDRIRNK